MRRILFILQLLLLGNAVADEEIPGLVIEKIQDGVYLHKSFSRVEGFGLVSSNGLVVVEGENAFMVDTPWSEADTEKLVEWINENDLTLQGSISTHSHEDRTAGMAWLNTHEIPTYASALTNGFLEKAGMAQAHNAFEGETLSLGDGLGEVLSGIFQADASLLRAPFASPNQKKSIARTKKVMMSIGLSPAPMMGWYCLLPRPQVNQNPVTRKV